MDARITQLLAAYELGNITRDALLTHLPEDIGLTKEYVETEINAAIDHEDLTELDSAIRLLWVFEDHEQLLSVLHRLVLVPYHYRHQFIVRSLQLIGNPRSVPVLRAALETNFDYLAYTGSKRRVIAKWFS